MILAIDTSTEQASVALMETERIRAEWSWTAQRNHSRHLTRVIRQLLSVEGLSAAALSAVVAACGPGSFSGVRVGVSEAKGLASALHIPLVGISTLDVVGFQALPSKARTRTPPLEVWAAIPAGRGDLHLARYRGSYEEWERAGEYQTLGLEDAVEAVLGADLVSGPGAEMLVQRLAGRADAPLVEPAARRLRRAGYLAELGRRHLQSGGPDQRDSLEPLYLRRPAAEEKRERAGQE